jgi:hypothetical protein
MKTSKFKYILVGVAAVFLLSTGAWADGNKIDRQKISKGPQYGYQHNNGHQQRNPGHGSYNNHQQPQHRSPQGNQGHDWGRKPNHHDDRGPYANRRPYYHLYPDYRPIHDALAFSVRILDPAFAIGILTGHQR